MESVEIRDMEKTEQHVQKINNYSTSPKALESDRLGD